MPLVSIIIPAYRAENFIIRAVNSLFQQSLMDWEAIIISDDQVDYEHFLSKHNIADTRLKFTTTGNIGSGPSIARNIGLDISKSEIIATLDADDSFDKHKLEMMLPMAMEYGLAVSNMNIIDNATNAAIPNLQYQPLSREIKYNELLAATAYGHSVIVFKKLSKNLHWSDEVKHCEDLLFMTLLFDYYGKAFYFQDKLHSYYLHNQSICRTETHTDNFYNDRSKIISLLESEEIQLNNPDIKNMLKAYLQAGIAIDKSSEKQGFSYNNYMTELRNICQFLPS